MIKRQSGEESGVIEEKKTHCDRIVEDGIVMQMHEIKNKKRILGESRDDDWLMRRVIEDYM
jgi:hypothetical protein